MRKACFLFACLILALTLLPFLSSAQSKATQKEAIRQEFKLINSDPALKKLTLKNEAFLEQMTDGGGELTGFYKNGQLVKIVAWIELSDGNKVVEYYFKNGALIFVYGQFNTWVYNAKRDEFDHSKTKILFEGRYYFHQQKLLEQITQGYMHADDEPFYKEQNLLTTASQYTRLLEQKKER